MNCMMCEQISTAAGVVVTTSSLATAVTASSAVGSVAGHTAPQTTHHQWSSSSHRSGAGTAGHRSSHADTRDDITSQFRCRHRQHTTNASWRSLSNSTRCSESTTRSPCSCWNCRSSTMLLNSVRLRTSD